nr:hypothetical protein [Tanacetum cinerariifolium]
TGIPPYFKRMYVCLADVREGFLDGCRKYLGFDGCFLKGVVKDGGEWTFMSDKQKGLLNGVQAIFPQAEHRLCARHIYVNWYSDFRGEQMKLAFYSIAKCANEAQLRQRLDEIDSIQTGAKQSLENKDINKWCRAFFKSGTKYDCVYNNSTEAWNFVLISARSMPIISMNESIREYFMERRIQRINFSSKWKLDCGPNIMDIVNENCTAGCKWKIKWNGADEFQVYYGRTQHCVHIGDKTCSCEAWKLSEAYNHPIKVVGSEEFWPNSDRVELSPPILKPMPGRPKKARRRRKYEPKKSKTRLSRHGRDMHCGNCNSNTHNSKTVHPPRMMQVKQELQPAASIRNDQRQLLESASAPRHGN